MENTSWGRTEPILRYIVPLRMTYTTRPSQHCRRELGNDRRRSQLPLLSYAFESVNFTGLLKPFGKPPIRSGRNRPEQPLG
uniref:Uncharacterized protein n=1 Tax=Heterorhabditis bacteriophora TaxID=37862 RepID=A0A1I7XI40_HETBA